MFDNIGKKIKSLATMEFIGGIVLSVIIGYVFIFSFSNLQGNSLHDKDVNTDMIFYGILIVICGPIASYITSMFLYGFGELIEKTCAIEQNTRCGKVKSEAQSNIDSERIHKIERLRSQGLITEKEYLDAIKKEQ